MCAPRIDTSSRTEPLVPISSGIKSEKGSYLFVYVAFLFPAFAGLLFGFDIGGASSAITSMTHVTGIDDSMKSVITAASLMGATLGSVMVFWVGEPLGRRRELLIGASLYLIGSIVSVVAPGNGSVVSIVIVGRIIYGLGIAFSMHAAPVYISEMAPSAIRGLLVSLKEGFIVGGILVGFVTSVIAEACASETAVFRVIWAVPLAIAPIILVGMTFMPPSPRWLLLRAQRQAGLSLEPLGEKQPLREAAFLSLTRFRRGMSAEAVEAELAEVEMTLQTETADAGSWAELFSSKRALVAGLGLITLQQLTGQPSVLYYQEDIFREAGFGDFASKASVIVGGAKLLATLFTVRFVDRFGRRPLLFAGISLMLVALGLLVAAFQLASEPDTSAAGKDVELAQGWPPIVVTALVIYVCGYQVGFGPIAWLIISEVFPIKTRTRALSLAVIVNFGFNLLTTLTLNSIQTAMDHVAPGKGSSYLFLIYAAFCVFSLLFVSRCVPETKGKTLEEIEEIMR